ncbi:type II secretion system ATPase GspE [Candidatus Williamhamiltonella defendens]|uniref:Type II secretion system protein E n=1 Tax=Candidatus Hamiltonella defensa (Bemisia tabaci) TaxID=672795 RepID=A0A249DWM7_9ENTR|nr:type II secretion system ATPase GspE [Candidatus Hamiltonella defensa]ASX25769.1 type II secretion system protein GspE [Candidatus Hamiltonella defensa (Bemisia tabaci)]CED78951.1 General secretion pathway protein E [Candidatus Hamiltonella defensa (Bemisia tabaci)]
MISLRSEKTGITRLPFSYARRFSVIVETDNAAVPTLYYVPPLQKNIFLEVRRVTGIKLRPFALSANDFKQRLSTAYQRDSIEARQLMENISSESDFYVLAEELPITEDLLESEDDAPIIKLINAMLGEAIKEVASDIHIETFENALLIRFRIDGILREILRLKRQLAALLVSRIKVMAKLDIAEKRIPQDGRITLLVGGRSVDVRVSIMPSAHGERVVLRLLDKHQGILNLNDLGMSSDLILTFRKQLFKPHGILLVTGPTGSGKTTTLYSGLQELNRTERNILTVEDPIEYVIEGVGQTQVNSKIEMTFARGLRAILRQDPDVVMIGEIRDLETAQIAVQASLTGHLVLSTLHTNTALGAVTRLKDMGIEPFLISSSLVGVLAQRLVRTLCPDCSRAELFSNPQLDFSSHPVPASIPLYHPIGCKKCHGKGYRGRTGIYELMLVDETLRHMIHEKASEQDMEKYIRRHTLAIQDDGIAKVRAGKTTFEEVLRVTQVE